MKYNRVFGWTGLKGQIFLITNLVSNTFYPLKYTYLSLVGTRNSPGAGGGDNEQKHNVGKTH